METQRNGQSGDAITSLQSLETENHISPPAGHQPRTHTHTEPRAHTHRGFLLLPTDYELRLICEEMAQTK